MFQKQYPLCCLLNFAELGPVSRTLIVKNSKFIGRKQDEGNEKRKANGGNYNTRNGIGIESAQNMVCQKMGVTSYVSGRIM